MLFQDDAHAPYSIFNYNTSPGRRNHTFKQVPCFRSCKLVVKKYSSVDGANSNSSVTKCEMTPKLGMYVSIYQVLGLKHHITVF